jgi:hypothetical protein
MRRSLEIRPEPDLLLRQQLKNFPASRGVRLLVGQRAIEGDIPPGEKSVQTHGIHLMRHFPVCHLRSVPLRESAPANLSTGRREVPCVNEA